MSLPSNGRVMGIKDLVDNLAVSTTRRCSPKAAPGAAGPELDLAAFKGRAQKLTALVHQEFGRPTSLPVARTRSGTGRRCSGEAGGPDPQLWQHQGGIRLAGRAERAGRAAHHVRHRSARCTLTRPTPAYANLFNSGKIGMLVTGPWDLSAFPNIQVRRPGHPVVPGTDRRTSDHLRARITGWSSTTAPSGSIPPRTSSSG